MCCSFTIECPPLAAVLMHLIIIISSTAAINVTKVTVDISSSDDNVIPVVLDLQDDSIVEPTDFYEVTIINTTDPNVVVGVANITFIIVNDDDDEIGKILAKHDPKIWIFIKLNVYGFTEP